MSAFRYRIVAEWSDEDEAFVARVPALAGCAAHGSSSAAAAREVQLAAEAMLKVMRECGMAIPPEDATAGYSGQIRLRLTRSLHEHLARMATAEGSSLNQLMVTLLSGAAGRAAGVPSGDEGMKAVRGRIHATPARNAKHAKRGTERVAAGRSKRRP